MTTLYSYFRNDFSELSLDVDRIFSTTTASGESKELATIKQRTMIAFNSAVRYQAFYIPESENVFGIVVSIIENLSSFRSEVDTLGVTLKFYSDVTVGKLTPVYSNQLYVYTETLIPENEIEQLNHFCTANSLLMVIRSQDYLKAKWN